LRGILPRVIDETRRALDSELEALNKASIGERLKIAKRSEPKVSAPDGGWQVRILENTDDDVEPGDIVIHSELALPAKTEFGAGSMTKRIATRRMGGRESSSQKYEPAEPTRESAQPSHDRDGAVPGAVAYLDYEEQGVKKTYAMTKDQIVVGRGGRDYWTDLRLETMQDVSREHFRLRRDPATGRFFLKDLSRLGTSINGEMAPSSIEFVDGEKRDRNVETPVPDQARIGLAGVAFIAFRSASSNG
jgi:FHA domain-containing protein